MEGVPQGVGSRSIHPSHHTSSHGGRHRGYVPSDATSLLASPIPFMMPSYPMMMMPNSSQPSCAETGVTSPAYKHHSADRPHGSDRGRTLQSYEPEHAYKPASFAAPPSSSQPSMVMPFPQSSDQRLSSAHVRATGDQYSNPVTASQASTCTAPAARVNYSHFPEQPAQKQSASLEPPKKPLSPYMRFSKSIWFQVKAVNPQLSVCQLGAMIGRMWRELSEEDKRRHLDDFHQDKIRYDNELKRYLKATGLRAKDLKAIARSQPKSKSSHRSRSSTNSQQSNASMAQVAANTNTQFAAQAAFMGLPLAGMPIAAVGMPAGMLAPAGAMGMIPHFSQVWTGQQYAGQPASAAMMGIAGQIAQGLYSNGYMSTPVDGTVVGAHQVGSTLSASKQAMLSHEMYRLSKTLQHLRRTNN